MKQTEYPAPQLFIAGQWRNSDSGDTMPVINPADGAILGELPVASHADLDEALSAADSAFKLWRNTNVMERAGILHKAAGLIRERAEYIGRITTLEQGKLVSEATQEAYACADIFDWYAEEARRAYGRIVPSKFPGVRNLVFKEPIGPAAAFTPWNFPTTIPSRKIGAALAAGCSMVMKPAEETPASTLELARALDDAGLPKGALNIVFGVPADISEYLIASPVIRKISFTGSTAIGKHLAGLAARRMTPTTMELGGHAPVIIFDDADLDKAVPPLIGMKYRNSGQICITPTRFFVHERIHDEFIRRFSEGVARIKPGNGLDPNSGMGPLAHERRLSFVGSLIDDALTRGATAVQGGAAIGGDGYFWQPTLLSEVADGARIMTEEPFGPVAVTQRFSDFDEVVEKANSVPYGLSGYAFSQSARTCADIADALEVGMLGINHCILTGPETPFGGVKESGHGSEGGIEGLDAYLITKYVAQG